MKNLLYTTILLFSISINAQVYQTFSMHFVKVEGDLEAFETVQSEYMQKVAQNAVNNGDIAFWAFLKRHTWDGINDEDRWNYLFVQSNSNVSAILSPKNSWWNNVSNVLSKEEQAKAEKAPVMISDKVLEFMAHRIVSNVRELEGALNRILAHAMLVGREITIESTAELLSDLL